MVNALEAENIKTFVPPIYGEGFNLTPEPFKNDDEAQTDNFHYNVTW
ncbi:MAG: hypothetical protein II948_02585 [Synergistaceae bacterium]|nr:hypothetical protein [Synergistaceae bacterium]MBR0221953.1 hypothetical protein [Synergistaceae bacterium]